MFMLIGYTAILSPEVRNFWLDRHVDLGAFERHRLCM